MEDISLKKFIMLTIIVCLASLTVRNCLAIYHRALVPEVIYLEALPPTPEQVKQEIILQSERFGVNTDLMLSIAQCESRFDWKAKNPESTGRGVYQYLIGTWEETESAKLGLERNNYKANIREAMIDVANGELWRWSQCL